VNNEEEAALARAIVDKTVFGYALAYMVLDGRPFDFKGHNYLIKPYQDNHPYQVIEKAAQMGASVLGMAKAFYVCDKLNANTIYFFPTDEDVREFSKTRVAPIIRDSPHIREIVDDVDSVGVRQIGRGFLYFRGMRSQIRMKSAPADFLVFDELDEVDAGDKNVATAEQRLNHSALRWKFMLSTPTFEDYGVDRIFKMSDQQYWNVICKHCDAKNILEKQWPECVKRLSDAKAILICRKCGNELETGYGEWIAENPTRERIRGYHFCGLYNPYADLVGMLETWEEGNDDRVQELMRQQLGIPYVTADRQLSIEQVKRCCDPYQMIDSGEKCYMGVDQRGRELHVVIRGREKFTRKPMVLFIGRVKTFHDLDLIMLRYDISLAVVDGTPNQHSAREFMARFPGRVYLAYYNADQRGSYKWKEANSSDDDYMVTVNRTEALDNMYEEITRRDVALPTYNDSEVAMFCVQLTKLARMHEVEEHNKYLMGTLKAAIYKKLGEEHYAHAMSYSLIAMGRYGAPATTAIVKSPTFATTVSTRRNGGLF
jgi:hypothetical protein